MKCIICGGDIEKRNVTFVYDEDDEYIFVKNVPASVCSKCGEKMYSPKVADRLLKIAKTKLTPTKIVKVPVFEFSKR